MQMAESTTELNIAMETIEKLLNNADSQQVIDIIRQYKESKVLDSGLLDCLK